MSGIKDYSTTPANNNAAPPNGFPEGMAPASVNDGMRQVMADTRSWYEDPAWIDYGDTVTYSSGTVFLVPTDLTARYSVGTRIKAIGTTPFSVEGVISASSYSAPNTTVTIVWDSGSMDSTLTDVSINQGLKKSQKFLDSLFSIFNATDVTKKIAFALSGITTATTRTITIPDKSGTMAMTSDIVAATTNPIFPVTASVGSNALTLTLNACNLDFRSSTAGSGTVNTRTVSSPISVVISSGSTLGTINAIQSRIVIIAIDNAGTVELAAVNQAGGTNLDETGLISTTAEGGAGGADSATAVYSTTARTNVPYRVVGYVTSTQSTAGTWATSPSNIQGSGGQNQVNGSIGYGQTWQTVTRTSGTTYYNTTNKPIMVIANFGSVVATTLTTVINGVTIPTTGSSSNTLNTHTFIVPAGHSYVMTASAGGLVVAELR